MKTHNTQATLAGILLLSALATLTPPNTATAALVTGDVLISIDNNALSSATVSDFFPNGILLERYFDASYNETAISKNTPGGTSDTQNLIFSINTNTSIINYGVRKLQATTMDTDNTSIGRIGLSGALRYKPADNTSWLASPDMDLQKSNGNWFLQATATPGGRQTFYQLTNTVESLDANGMLNLSGDLIFGTVNAVPGGLPGGWGGFLGANPNTIVGHLTLAPAAVPVPAAVWLFGSALLGFTGLNRRKL